MGLIKVPLFVKLLFSTLQKFGRLVLWEAMFILELHSAETQEPDGEVPDNLLKDLLDKSYQLVLGGFSKKKQREILEVAQSVNIISCCGTDCSKCGCFGNVCKGCSASLGKVFHAPDGQACPIYECVVNQKDMKGCGECGHIPCDIWRKTKDPAFTEEEFERNIQERVDRLKKG